MTLKEAIINQGNSAEEAQLIIDTLVEDFLAGSNPEELLDDQELELDYLQDLLDACEAYEGGQS